MKKVISICLILVMVLAAFVGCSKNTGKEDVSSQAVKGKEKLLSQAVDGDAYDINNDSFDNHVKAKNSYCNKVLKLKGTVIEIAEDHVILGGSYSTEYRVNVYLPTEEMLNLEKGESIVVVGETNDELVEDTENVAQYSFDYHYYQMPTAYLVQDRFEITGTLGSKNTYQEDPKAYYILIGEGNSGYEQNIFFADDVDTASLSKGQKIKFEAKCVNENDTWNYKDAKIIEILK